MDRVRDSEAEYVGWSPGMNTDIKENFAKGNETKNCPLQVFWAGTVCLLH